MAPDVVGGTDNGGPTCDRRFGSRPRFCAAVTKASCSALSDTDTTPDAGLPVSAVRNASRTTSTQSALFRWFCNNPGTAWMAPDSSVPIDPEAWNELRAAVNFVTHV
jgi:hypothetical protein